MEFAAETRVEWAEGLRHEFHELTRREQPLAAMRPGQWVEDSFSGQSALEGTTRNGGRDPPSAVLSTLRNAMEDGSAVRIVRLNGANTNLRTCADSCRATYSGFSFLGEDYTSIAERSAGQELQPT
jgi:hypothetical protein